MVARSFAGPSGCSATPRTRAISCRASSSISTSAATRRQTCPTSTGRLHTAASRSCATNRTARGCSRGTTRLSSLRRVPRATTASSGSICSTKVVRELDASETEVLTYRYLDDMTQEEIASLLGLSRKTVGKRLERVREVVRRLGEPGGSR